MNNEIRNNIEESIVFRTEEQVCKELESQGIFEKYLNLSEFQQLQFMEFCTGKSLKVLTYDGVFKYIFNNAGNYEYLEHFLTAVLGFEVEIVELLPTESERLVESGSVMILDVVAKTADGSVINVEIQKSPYMFSGQRESCYAADILSRQYNQKKHKIKIQNGNTGIGEGSKSKKKASFDYSLMRPVYTVILLEKSYYQFLDYPNIWKHTGKVTFDSGIELDYLYNFVYVTLDKFRELHENEEEELNRWIYLLCANTPEQIMHVAGMSDEFFEIIRKVSMFCMDAERVLDMVSEALIDFDRGTEERMLEETMAELEKIREKAKRAEEERERVWEEAKRAWEEIKKAKEETEKAWEEIKRAKEETRKLQEMLLATGQYTQEELDVMFRR